MTTTNQTKAILNNVKIGRKGADNQKLNLDIDLTAFLNKQELPLSNKGGSYVIGSTGGFYDLNLDGAPADVQVYCMVIAKKQTKRDKQGNIVQYGYEDVLLAERAKKELVEGTTIADKVEAGEVKTAPIREGSDADSMLNRLEELKRSGIKKVTTLKHEEHGELVHDKKTHKAGKAESDLRIMQEQVIAMQAQFREMQEQMKLMAMDNLKLKKVNEELFSMVEGQ
jgi:hypothetical protein